MVFTSRRVLYCYICFVHGCWLYPIIKFTILTIGGYREKWEHSLHIEWTIFGFCLHGYGLTVTQVRSYLVYLYEHRPPLQFTGLSYYNFQKTNISFCRSSTGGRARVKMVRSSGRFCLFSETKLQVLFPLIEINIFSSWMLQYKL